MEQEKQYHIACKKGDLASYLLMPGDPGRVSKIAETWESYKEIAFNRQFRSATGFYKKTKLSCLSTGIGAPGTAIALEEAAKIGVDTFIRVGSTGAVSKDIECGDLIINTGAVRLEGTSGGYVRSEYPACANYEVILALIEACERLGFKYHVGIGASWDSFYTEDKSRNFKNYSQSYSESVRDDLIKANVLNFEMEASALFTIANLYNLKAGSICVVFNSLVKNDKSLNAVGEKNLAIAANEAVSILSGWDKLKKQKKKKYFYPGLIK